MPWSFSAFTRERFRECGLLRRRRQRDDLFCSTSSPGPGSERGSFSSIDSLGRSSSQGARKRERCHRESAFVLPLFLLRPERKAEGARLEGSRRSRFIVECSSREIGRAGKERERESSATEKACVRAPSQQRHEPAFSGSRIDAVRAGESTCSDITTKVMGHYSRVKRGRRRKEKGGRVAPSGAPSGRAGVTEEGDVVGLAVERLPATSSPRARGDVRRR